MSDDIMTWAHKLSAWVSLVRQRANFPDHPLHTTVYHAADPVANRQPARQPWAHNGDDQ